MQKKFGLNPLMFDKEDSLNLHDYVFDEGITVDRRMPDDKSNWSSFEKWWSK